MIYSGVTELALKATHQQHPMLKKVQTVLPYQGCVGVIMLMTVVLSRPLPQRAHSSFTWDHYFGEYQRKPSQSRCFPKEWKWETSGE